jgi:hypothetical protein
MTLDEYQQRLQAKQTEDLHRLLAASTDPLDQRVLATDPKFAEPVQTRQHMASPMDSATSPEPAEFDEQRFQQALAPGREMFVPDAALPQPLPGIPPRSEAQQQADEFRDFFHALPGHMRYSIGASGGIPALANQFMQQRQSTAQKQQALQEQKRQHDIGLLEKAMTHPQAQMMLEELGKSSDYSMAPQARSLSKAMKEGDYASFDAYKAVIPPDVQQRFVDGQLPHHELVAWLDSAREATKVNAKEQAKAYMLKTALDMPKEKRSPYQQQLADEHQAALALKNTEIELKKAQTVKALADAKGQDHIRQSDMFGHDREAFTQQLYKDKYGPNVLYKNLAQDEQAQVNAKVAAMQGLITQSRVGGTQEAMGTVPVGQLGKSQNYRDPVTGKAAPSWATQKDLTNMGAVEIEPQQIQTVSQLANVDEAMKEILKAGSAITRRATGTGLLDVPAGLAQKPLVEIFKKYAGDPNMAVLQSAINRITPALTKLGGDTANVAVAERQIYADSIFNPADTLESFTAKVRSIMNAQKRTREAMGFIPDENAYIKKLVARGLSDKQIEALVQERRRTFH